ncbi:MAG: hypothetical protein HOD97_02705 [Candidatus Marinimicrobia bacterium]|jgi:hypothetical protein|nr:hypothetical protein [Candidatus Neomarinimicrobiota bacterium]MBT3617275.1 hypothetical protein [Candidatus Neomarinimicrobiota bacterium]MBT3828838.1 hypothetical protein [Candidatus Neomarinimicrobiota bacterium]MBT3997809.1 hypothetical protein [Candidatus Neomarinimicrobiota bacterium]MBT4280523.1 hypothetical protein [Candidatus Neomarinimicrobiota bacterium]
MKNGTNTSFIIFPVALMLFIVTCDTGIVTSKLGDSTTCEGCHINKEALVNLVASEESGTSNGGGGG